MKPSFLTLHEIKFAKVRMEVDHNVRTKAEEYDFDDALIGCDIKHGQVKDDPNAWWIGFGFANSNEGVDTNKCPYLFEFQAVGFVSIDPDFKPEELKEKLVFESGSALIYGAIREMTINLTSRCFPGALMLPTPMFKDTFEEYQEKNSKKKGVKTSKSTVSK